MEAERDANNTFGFTGTVARLTRGLPDEFATTPGSIPKSFPAWRHWRNPLEFGINSWPSDVVGVGMYY